MSHLLLLSRLRIIFFIDSEFISSLRSSSPGFNPGGNGGLGVELLTSIQLPNRSDLWAFEEVGVSVVLQCGRPLVSETVQSAATIPKWRALIAQLGERQTEDLKALCSIHSQGRLHYTLFCFLLSLLLWTSPTHMYEPLLHWY